MPTAVDDTAHLRYRAPRRSGECFIDPLPGDWDLVWSTNCQTAAAYPTPLSAWRAIARRELFHLARQYTGQYRNLPSANDVPERFILSGHQPSLFHPGVWFKNFVMDQCARRFRATAVQLLIDNDLYRQAAIRVPTGSLEQPRIEYAPFDRLEQVVPYEQARVHDEATFRSFGDRVAHALRPLIEPPGLIDRYWPRVVREHQRCQNIGQALAASRHALEAEHGLETLELPLSSICRTSTFRQFAAHLIGRIDEFADVHNRCLAEYRSQNRLRSPNHPIPDLSVRSDEFEAPFWVWSTPEPIRRRLYIARRGSELVLFDRHHFDCRTRDRDLVDRLTQMESDQVAIRPRALVTTMYARLVLGDVFLHGIGGAIYDAVTDEIIRRFFSVVPPKFLTATATVHLPIPIPEIDELEMARIEWELREIAYHPERLLHANDPEVDRLARQKREWVHRDRIDGELKQRHDAIALLNRQLAARLQIRAAELHSRRTMLVNEIRRAKILGSREFSFVLFPDSLIASLETMSRRN